MGYWHWLLWPAVGLGVVAVLFGLDRLGLWLEDRGWLYYRHKKPSSGLRGGVLAFQQYIEPSLSHVQEIRRIKRGEEGIGAVKDRFLARLLACFEANPVNKEEVRLCLIAASQAGLDWRQVYDEAVQIHKAVRPEQAACLPFPDDVAPIE